VNVSISTPKFFLLINIAMQEAKCADMEAAVEVDEKVTWEAGHRVWLIVLTLAFVSLIVALDATILVTALPVRPDARPGYCNVADRL
jgi:hypothetical protein